MHLEPLPPQLEGAAAFSVAEARRLGVPLGRLRRTGLVVPTRGARARAEPRSVEERARAFAPVLPSDALYSHLTAAQLWRLPLPAALEAQHELDVMTRTGRAAVRRPGCIGHRGVESRAAATVKGLPVVDLEDLWVDLGEVLSRGLGVDDLVILGDDIVRRLEGQEDAVPGFEIDGVRALGSALAARVRPRGKRALEEALTLVRSGSCSPMETRARLMFVRAGFPEPELNAEVEAKSGGWILTGDLVWRRQRVIGEYQGEEHAKRKRRSLDADRRELAADEHWRIIEIFAEDVYQRARRVRTLGRFATALGLDRSSLCLG